MTIKPIVYAVHQPSRFDYEHRCMVPIDLSPVDQFGTLKFVFEGNERPPEISTGFEQMRSVLSAYTANDYLVITGDLDLFTWAAMLAFFAAGQVSLLKWSGRLKKYEVFESPSELIDILFND